MAGTKTEIRLYDNEAGFTTWGQMVMSAQMDKWIKITDELPPYGEDVLILHIGVRQNGFVTGGEIKVGYLSETHNTFYPGGLGIGWVSHWRHLPTKPVDIKIMEL